MPRFVKDGPIVPDRLVQELEKDRVVIFCGAGISMGAGLPNFKGLVDHCYTELGADKPDDASEDWIWLDRMLGSLEASHAAQMRIKVAERLDLVATDLTLHEAILKLARLRSGANGTRLVTTNFDLFFEQARAGMQLGIDYHSAPVLPIPRNDHSASWRSLVYLHGRLEPPSHGNQHLVLTSADFGRAYLTDAWAARFVARLFAEFTVLFIGYSLNDPVLRYMTDAFAADDAQARSGRKRGPAYIFVAHDSRTPDPTPYRQRRLEPIFYRPIYQHRLLKKTLIEWADARQDYLASIQTLVERTAPRLPTALEPSDTANLVWAVCGRPEDDGHGARLFSKLDPPPPIEWLAEFERRDANARAEHAAEVKLALAEGREPPLEPVTHIDSLFPLRTDNRGVPGLSASAFGLLDWLCNKLTDQQLINWVIAKLAVKRRAHPRLRYAIRRKLDTDSTIPGGYQCFWRIVASEGDWATSQLAELGTIDLGQQLASKRDTPWFAQELAAALRPYLELEPSFRAATGAPIDATQLRSIADARVTLGHPDLRHLLEQIDATPAPDRFWAGQLDLLTRTLSQVYELFALTGHADAVRDPSTLQRPSIEPHPQNQNHADWTRLYDLIWRGWCHIDQRGDSAASRMWIARWRAVPYAGFRRLVLAAMRASAHFSSHEKLKALLDD
jgi:hypothetical protein